MFIKGDYYLNCMRHGELTSRDAVYAKGRANKTGNIRYGCKACRKEYKTSPRIEKRSNAEMLEKARRDRIKYRDRVKRNDTIQAKNRIIFLKDSYVKKLLYERNHIPKKDITPELIELKRSILLLKREIKKRSNEKHEGS